MAALSWFWEKEKIIPRCNASFITLIPKVSSPEGLGDFCTISLIGIYYKIVTQILAERLKRGIGKVISNTQSAFIKGRQILDEILIANETINVLRDKRKPGLIFKVDFEKAYDSVEWSCLFETLRRMGFREKWIRWVHECLHSSKVSVLVNGAPTKEFTMGKGLRQGDLIAPFLFLLVAENLNLMMEETMEKGLFEGIHVGQDDIPISHLQFADDAIFFGRWSHSNLKNLFKLLECFCKLSGMKTNMGKSKLFGVGIKEAEVGDWTRGAGCEGGKFPFNYLGVPVGASMCKREAWTPVIDKMKGKLASWKKVDLIWRTPYAR